MSIVIECQGCRHKIKVASGTLVNCRCSDCSSKKIKVFFDGELSRKCGVCKQYSEIVSGQEIDSFHKCKDFETHKSFHFIFSRKIISEKFLPNKFYSPGEKESSVPEVVKKTRTIFFVFIGQLGYEILNSQGWIRKLKFEHPEIEIGIASRANVKFLYGESCDIYLDFTLLFSKHESISNSGDKFSKEEKGEIEKRITESCTTSDIKIYWSQERFQEFKGINWGIIRDGQYHWIRNGEVLHLQKWERITLEQKEYAKNKSILYSRFPKLLTEDYVVLQDRVGQEGWGQESYPIKTWLSIIKRVVDSGKLVVLIGYSPYKKKDSFSRFYQKEFQNLPGVINVSEFLTKHIEENLLYQAIILKRAYFWLGICGSIFLLPLLLGIDSYALSAERTDADVLDLEASVWNELFYSELGTTLTLFHAKLTGDEAENILEREGFFEKLKPERPKQFDNRNISFMPRLPKNENKEEIPVVTFCMNRFFYTKYCWTRLHMNSKIHFDQYVIDNGSLDETREWLLKNRRSFKKIILNKTNIGLKSSIEKVLPYINSEFLILGSNDLEPVTSNIIGILYDFWEKTKGEFLFSPIISGIRSKIDIEKDITIHGYKAQIVDKTGSCLQVIPIKLLKQYLSQATEWRANQFCTFCAKKGVKNLYLTDAVINHFETSEGQIKRYPDYPVRNEIGKIYKR
jgi:phage FluMu protein Com